MKGKARLRRGSSFAHPQPRYDVAHFGDLVLGGRGARTSRGHYGDALLQVGQKLSRHALVQRPVARLQLRVACQPDQATLVTMCRAPSSRSARNLAAMRSCSAQ